MKLLLALILTTAIYSQDLDKPISSETFKVNGDTTTYRSFTRHELMQLTDEFIYIVTYTQTTLCKINNISELDPDYVRVIYFDDYRTPYGFGFFPIQCLSPSKYTLLHAVFADGRVFGHKLYNK